MVLFILLCTFQFRGISSATADSKISSPGIHSVTSAKKHGRLSFSSYPASINIKENKHFHDKVAKALSFNSNNEKKSTMIADATGAIFRNKITSEKKLQKRFILRRLLSKIMNIRFKKTPPPPPPPPPLITEVEEEVTGTWKNLVQSMHGAKLDSLILLIATSTIIPLFKMLKTSPILGFLITGTLLGPCGLKWVNDVHMIDSLGELGIVFFLFEMGLELSLDRLMSMRKDVFGLGTCQFLLTSIVGSRIAMLCGLSAPAAVTIGGSLALSSSAFVLQLLKDKGDMGTRHGKASFGILLLQDIAVVPLLVVVELLASGGNGILRALGIAGTKALITLSAMSFIGRSLLDKVFYIVAKSGSHEAFLSIILTSVLLMSYVTQGIGLSNTLGAFLAGLLLSETRYRYQIEADIAPFRGLLLGFFFLTVGFSIDLKLLIKEGPIILKLVSTLLVGKALIITGLCMAFGLSFASAQQTGLLNAQAGEFAFVVFGLAERVGLISKSVCRTLLTTVALSMAVTPLLATIGSKISNSIEQNQGNN